MTSGMLSGFSKFSLEQKRRVVAELIVGTDPDRGGADSIIRQLESFQHSDPLICQRLAQFAENTISNFYLPFCVVPNFLINGRTYCVPMVTEESSVVAACSKAARFWYQRGGFQAQVASTRKIGQVHLEWTGTNPQMLQDFFTTVRPELQAESAPLLAKMERRGGGLQRLELQDHTAQLPHYYQIWAEFETCDAMGANLINTILESWGQKLLERVSDFDLGGGQLSVIMSILSNYTPQCGVTVTAECPVEELASSDCTMTPAEFAHKMVWASNIAQVDLHRAATHNKGIFNGVDAVALATGNDFRAVEACGHTHAAVRGFYRGLSQVQVQNGQFRLQMELPLAVGTVGGLTSAHPMAALSLDLLGRPSAAKLMEIIGSVGLAQNFAALCSLVTSGIQQGHMKMHFTNVCYQLGASGEEIKQLHAVFAERSVSFRAVSEALAQLRNQR